MKKLILLTTCALVMGSPAFAADAQMDKQMNKQEQTNKQEPLNQRLPLNKLEKPEFAADVEVDVQAKSQEQTESTTESYTKTERTAMPNQGAEYIKSLAQGDIVASEFIGKRIYATEKVINFDTVFDSSNDKDWNDIGEINDVVLDRDGSVKAVILGVGGFLGMGEKDVAVSMDSIRFVNEKGSANEYFLVVNSNKKMLGDAPTFKR